MWRRALAPLCLLAGLAFAQSGSQPAAALERARQAATALAEQIRGLLGEELAKGSFAGAVEACSTKAQAATQDFAGRERISIRRVSLKQRNPGNAPDAWEAARLRELERRQAGGTMPAEVHEEAVVEGVRSLRYLRPITIQPMCLSCHGPDEQIPAEVKNVLRSRYGGDQATGYKAGNLRGAISVTVPLAAKR
jgi:hypothetical protein